MPTIRTLVSFTNANGYANGYAPEAGLTIDAAGDLFGTTTGGGKFNGGVVFEVAHTASGYAAAPTILVNFDSTNGSFPSSGLLIDADGNLFGTTQNGGVIGGSQAGGTAFELMNNGDAGYSLDTLVAFGGADGHYPENATLIADASGDLFGTTSGGGTSGLGTVFEIAKTASDYSTTPKVLVNFDQTNGEDPVAGLVADAAGNLFGTTYSGGADLGGTVFEIQKIGSSYATTPTPLASFDGAHPTVGGAEPWAGLIIDAAGNLFGTTYIGGQYGYGTAFEIPKTADGYGPLETLVNFDRADGALPTGNLMADAAGDLFGTTTGGGAAGGGTAFEIKKTAAGYGSTPTVLVSFNNSSEITPIGSLVADSAGDLFGATNNGGSVFEITPTAPNFFNDDAKADILWQNTNGDVELWNSNSGSGGFTYDNVGAVNASWQIAGTGDFNGIGEAGILWRNGNGSVELWNSDGSGGFTYDDLGSVNTSWQIAGIGEFEGNGVLNGAGEGVLWRNATNGGVELWNSNGSGGFTYDNLGSVNTSWQIAGTGDFTGTGEASILWRNANGDTELWNPNGSGGFTYDNLGSVNTSWQIAGTGDFTGTGEASILWRNANGGTELWNPNGSGGFTYQNLGVVNTSWQVAETGDFTGGGQSGILWRNTSGATELWNPNGSGGFTYENLGTVAMNWSAQKIFA